MRKFTNRVLLLICVLALTEGMALASGNAAPYLVVPLGDVYDPITAVVAVEDQIHSMGEINSVEKIAFVADYADAAISKAAAIDIKGNQINIDWQTVSFTRAESDDKTLEEKALEAYQSTESKVAEELSLQKNEDFREAYRGLFSTVTFRNIGEGELVVQIDPDIRNIHVDMIQVETPLYSLSFSPVELGGELTEPLFIKMKNVSEKAAPEIQVTMSNTDLSSTLTLTLPTGSADLTDMAIMDTNRQAYITHHNDVTSCVEGIINGSGIYSVGHNGTDFQDIQNLSAKTRKAILAMATNGITKGTSETTYSPDAPVTRGQFVTFLMRGLGTEDSWRGENHFSDVRNTYCYAYANRAAEKNYISGYSDGTFRPNQPLFKQQICKILGNVLMEKKKIKVPSNRDSWLKNYNDGVIWYAQDAVSILTRLNYISFLPNYRFNGEHIMTRAEVAELLYDTLLR